MRIFSYLLFLFFVLCAQNAAAQMIGNGAVPTYLPAQRHIVPYQVPAAQPTYLQQQPVQQTPVVVQPVMMQPAVVPQFAPLSAPAASAPRRVLPQYEQQVTAQKIWQEQIAQGRIASIPSRATPQMSYAQEPSPVPGENFAYAYGPDPAAPQLAQQPMPQPMMQAGMMAQPQMMYPQGIQPPTPQVMQPMPQQYTQYAPQYAPQYGQQQYVQQPVMQPQIMQQGAVQYAPPQQQQYAPPPRLRSGISEDAGRMVEKPLYEIGLGLAFGLTPAYPASEDTKFNFIPFPSIVYRGDVIRADREGARAVILEDDTFELGISVNASLPTDSDDVEARRGMPDLDFLAEIGPSLRATLFRDADEQVRFDLPLRMVIGIGGDDGLGYRGLLLQPEFKYRIFRLFNTSANAQFSLGPIFSLDGIGNYFYGVDAKYATATRPAFQAEEGYMGTEFGAFAAIPLDDRFRMFTGSRLMLHSGAANELSPLFKEEATISLVLGLTYSFYHSDEKVMVRD